MSLNEKVAYLKGLAEGLGLDPEAKESKLISVIIDTLADMAEEIDDLNENALDIGEELDAISDDLADVEEFLYGDDFDDDDDEYFFDSFGDDDDDDDDDCDDCDDDCDCEFCGGGDFSFQVDCPSCNAAIKLSDEDLASGAVTCSSCGEEIEIDFDDEDEDEEGDE
jgi:predicted Zn finger-like uncharacterized protein